jgi:putative methionine-R-sulfoxide reductase with GAF domain
MIIENLLRKLTTVRSRITAGNLAFVFLFVLSIPLIIADHSFLVNRIQEVTEVEIRADRLLLQASTRVAVSRTNLSRYIQGFTPDARAALSEAGQSTALLQEAAELPINAEQQQTIEQILVDLAEYERLINEIVAGREAGLGQMAQLDVQALQLGSDLGVRIDQTIRESGIRVTAANEAVFTEAQNRLVVLLITYFVILVLSFFLARFIQQSITNPIGILQQGAEQFRQGKWETTIPVSGNDELSSLAETFNQMAGDLAESQVLLEQRVSQRSQSLEISAQVSHNLSSILDLDAFAIAVVEQLQDTFGYYYVQLYLSSDTNESLFLKSATGQAGQKMLIRGHHIEKGRGIVGQAAASKKVVLAPDVAQESRWLSNPLLPETKSEAAVPIISRGRTLGVLDIQHNLLNGIKAEEITLLQSISDQIAIALENARLFDQIQRRANYEALLNRVTQKIQIASSVDQVLQITAQELGKALNADFASVELGNQKKPANGHKRTT